MSKLIKLSDAVGEALAKKAAEDNLSMAAEVAKLLSVTELPPRPVGTEYFDKKFDELKSLIEDTTIDRMVAPRGKGPVEISWGVMREVFFDFLKEHDQEWVADSVFVAIHEADAPEVSKYFAEDGHIYAQGPSGVKSVALVITPRLSSFLKEKGVLL